MKDYFKSADLHLGSHHNLSDLDKELQELQSKSEILISDFVILQTRNPSFEVACTPTAPATSVCKTDKVFVYSCPFGSSVPEIFHSSISSGIVSNMLGSSNQLLITDARFVEGTAGGAVAVTINNKECLIGIVITAISGRSDGCSSNLTIVCSMDSIWKSLRSVDPELAVSMDNEGMSTDDVQIRKRHGFNSIVLVKAGCHSGSGVIIDSDMKLVLTCGHVIQPSNSDILVSLSSPYGETTTIHCSADVLWISDVPDIALLKLNTTAQLQPVSLYDGKETNLAKASIYLYGYAKLSHRFTGISATHGIISNVVCDESQPVMLQTTATISEGASGGAVVLAECNVLVGIAACYVHDETGKRYCDISLAVPVSWIRPVIDAYRIQKLNDVKIGSVTSMKLWHLNNSSKCPRVVSKL
jgi:S1-C subfamily serine protease